MPSKQQTKTPAEKPENQHPAFQNQDKDGRPTWAQLKLVMGYPYPLIEQFQTRKDADKAVEALRRDGYAAVVVDRKHPALEEAEDAPGTYKAYHAAIYGIKRTHYVRFDNTSDGWSLVRKPQTTRFKLENGRPVPKE